MRTIYLAGFLVFMLMFMSVAQGQSPQETLTQYISDLQKKTNDYALREKIIKHVQTMSPAPAIPLEAEKYEGRAEFAIRSAKTEADFLDAAREYEKALLVAPWVPSNYFNQGIAFEKAGKPKEAMQSFEFYLLAAPNAQDAREVRKRIAGLEYAMEKSSKPPAPPEKKKLTDEELIRSLEGARYSGQTRSWSSPPTYIWENEFVIRDGHLSWRECIIEYGPDAVRDLPLGSCYTPYGNAGRMIIKGHVAKQILDGGMEGETFTISEDGNSISHKWGPNTFIFYRR